MKYISTLLLFSLFTLTVNAQTRADFIDALKEGDAQKLGLSFERDVEVCFDDMVEFYSRKQAVNALTKFFNNNKPVSYTPLHKGSAKGAHSGYTIGKLSTTDKNYRVYIFAHKVKGTYRVQEIRFDSKAKS